MARRWTSTVRGDRCRTFVISFVASPCPIRHSTSSSRDESASRDPRWMKSEYTSGMSDSCGRGSPEAWRVNMRAWSSPAPGNLCSRLVEVGPGGLLVREEHVASALEHDHPDPGIRRQGLPELPQGEPLGFRLVGTRFRWPRHRVFSGRRFCRMRSLDRSTKVRGGGRHPPVNRSGLALTVPRSFRVHHYAGHPGLLVLTGRRLDVESEALVARSPDGNAAAQLSYR